ncbi:hypothetical protein [[Phormidium] sp. ETS-05]|nr:hypothetical protein [[Phormidium] sp. ETS-05]
MPISTPKRRSLSILKAQASPREGFLNQISTVMQRLSQKPLLV